METSNETTTNPAAGPSQDNATDFALSLLTDDTDAAPNLNQQDEEATAQSVLFAYKYVC